MVGKRILRWPALSRLSVERTNGGDEEEIWWRGFYMMQPRPKSLSVDQDGGQAAVVVHLVHDVSSCADRVTWAARIMRMSPRV